MTARRPNDNAKRPEHPYRRVARWCGVGTLCIGASSLLGRAFALPFLFSFIPGYQPIAVSAALICLLLGGALYLMTSPRRRGVLRVLLGGVGVVTLFTLLEVIQLVTGARVGIDENIFLHYPRLIVNPPTRISPAASVLFLLIGLGQMGYLAQRIRHRSRDLVAHLIGLVDGLAVIGSGVFVLGYIYGTPFFAGTNFLPISAPAALAGLLLGMGMVALAGPAVYPLSLFAGDSTQSRLFRAFLPLTALLLLLLSLGQFYLVRFVPLNPALMATILIALFEIIIGGVILQVARGIGGQIDLAVAERRRAEAELRELNATLEQHVRRRTAELEASNRELEGFTYSVAHDLRTPLRSVVGFSEYVLAHYAERLDDRGQDYLRRMSASARRMGRLIDDLLHLARIGRVALVIEPVDISALAAEVIAALRARDPARQVEVEISPHLVVQGDNELLHIALAHLLDNAWKFTGPRRDSRIVVGERSEEGERVLFVRDNGVGFDMAYVDKLFQPFQRLHTEYEFPGTGISLAIVQRIIQRHGGRIWAEGAVGQGATIYFTVKC